LVKQLNDKRFKEPFVIIEALSAFSSPEATDALIASTLHDDSDIRVAAIQALGKTHDRQSGTIAALVRIVEEDAESNVRAEAVKTLFQLGAKGLIGLLTRLVQYDDPDVRTMAYHAFANMGDPLAVKPLAKQLSTVRGKERTAVRRALRRITRDSSLRTSGDYMAWYSVWKETQTNAHKGFRKGTFKVNGKKMSYRMAGQGSTVIALSSRRGGAIWGATLRHLAANHRVISYDAPGRGASKSRAGGFTLASELAMIDALRKHVRAKKVVIIADEVGALLATQYAITHAKQVRSLVLVTPTLTGSRGARDHIASQKLNKTARKELGQLDEQYGWFHPAAWTQYRNTVLNLGYVRRKSLAPRLEAFPITAYTDQRLARMMRGLKLAEQLGRVRTKVLIVRGEHDALPTQEAHSLARIARQHSHVSIQQLKGVGHYPQLESPQKLARTIRPFLAKKRVQ
jgi:pimeloyl-ACP methyl ester carboxylesterase